MCLAIPGKLVAVRCQGSARLGTVELEGAAREVNLAFVPEAAVGDHVVVQFGFAVSLLTEGEAAEVAALQAAADRS